MRLTCLRCGNQMELAASGPRVGTICTCGTEISYPEVYNTGVRPNERAAERLRYRAFRAAGLVKNLGGFAIGLALLGILFFPLALVGAVLGIYVLTMVRGPLGRYSGRTAAMAAIGVGVAVFTVEASVLWSYVAQRRAERLGSLQASAADDLRTLLRTERLFRAAQDRFGTLKESRYTPRGGAYTIYLGTDDYMSAHREGMAITDPLPADLRPRMSDTEFTAVAVANLDADPELDVWMVNHEGELKHVSNDVPWLSPREQTPEPNGPAELVVPRVAAPEDGGSLAASGDKTATPKQTDKAADKTATDKSTDAKSTSEKPNTTKAPDAKATPDKPSETKPASDKAATDKPANDKPATEKPASDKPSTSAAVTPTPDKAAASPSAEKPPVDPAAPKPSADKPAVVKPADKPTDKVDG